MANKTARQIDTDEVDVWNREDASELNRPSSLSAYDLSINARDWTVATIVEQVRQGNIDLDPAFQRRNAWRDHRRSRLLESFILGFPVPQIVLAENPRKKKSFIVIDGKQRLMTIAGLFIEDYREYWKVPELSGLEILETLNGVSLNDFISSNDYAQHRRQLENADIRTTIISGFKSEGVLYDIFYRINTGSVPLSSQELRQVLNRGAFARYLLEITCDDNPVWKVLGIKEPDARLRDVELLLRMIAWEGYSAEYAGNMKDFLDGTMRRLNGEWDAKKKDVKATTANLLEAIDAVRAVFGDKAGRKYKDDRYESALNRALFEVQVLHFATKAVRTAATAKRSAVVAAFQKLSKDSLFLSAIESTTKSLENTRTRFEMYGQMLGKALKRDVTPIQIGSDE